MNLATATLAQSSITAAQLWHQLESAESSEEIDLCCNPFGKPKKPRNSLLMPMPT